ncbi:RidA family protein [Pseudomonas sp. TH49]|uniref:RidA family protein n=1 Tax=Pseudomonas sp. TH49 TaxID=2796413 RepID=UPI001F5B2E52|nr:RidA family protein [Pseudomonas sp. TH49]
MSRKTLAAQERLPHKTANTPPSVLTPKGWAWNEPHGFVWGRVANSSSQTIYVSGQSSVDADGNILHKGDMGSQLEKTLDNLELVLAEGGATLANVVSVTYYTVDIQQFFGAMEILTTRMAKAGGKPTSTLIEVKQLYHPDILFELTSVSVV